MTRAAAAGSRDRRPRSSRRTARRIRRPPRTLPAGTAPPRRRARTLRISGRPGPADGGCCGRCARRGRRRGSCRRRRREDRARRRAASGSRRRRTSGVRSAASTERREPARARETHRDSAAPARRRRLRRAAAMLLARANPTFSLRRMTCAPPSYGAPASSESSVLALSTTTMRSGARRWRASDWRHRLRRGAAVPVHDQHRERHRNPLLAAELCSDTVQPPGRNVILAH